MPRKPITWIGSVIILGAGIYCFSGLFKYRSHLVASSTKLPLATVATFLALPLAIGAIFLWYYLIEKQGGGGKGSGTGPGPGDKKPDIGSGTGDQKPETKDQGSGTGD